MCLDTRWSWDKLPALWEGERGSHPPPPGSRVQGCSPRGLGHRQPHPPQGRKFHSAKSFLTVMRNEPPHNFHCGPTGLLETRRNEPASLSVEAYIPAMVSLCVHWARPGSQSLVTQPSGSDCEGVFRGHSFSPSLSERAPVIHSAGHGESAICDCVSGPMILPSPQQTLETCSGYISLLKE